MNQFFGLFRMTISLIIKLLRNSSLSNQPQQPNFFIT